MKFNWPLKKLGDGLVEIESGIRPEGGSVEKGVPSLGGEQLLPNGKIDWNNLRYIPEDFYDSLKKGKVKRGDILVVKDGATTGKTCYVDDLPFPKVAVNEHVFILRVKNPNILLDEFLFYILFSDIGQTQILKFFHGSTQGGINQKDIKNITIPIPPLEIQEQMVVYIKETFKKIDSLKELRKKT
ncbi:MAG: restriction endonuclease subunit S, partial [candidate division WOR-3 bacterium]